MKIVKVIAGNHFSDRLLAGEHNYVIQALPPPLKNMQFQNKSFKSVYTINLLDKMSKVKISRIIIPSTILYAVFIFHLSLTSNIGNVKHFLDTTLGHATKEILINSHLSFVLNFLE
ncbi:MAG: hypothetical protein WCB90_04345, partial [Methanosarcina sp.]